MIAVNLINNSKQEKGQENSADYLVAGILKLFLVFILRLALLLIIVLKF